MERKKPIKVKRVVWSKLEMKELNKNNSNLVTFMTFTA